MITQCKSRLPLTSEHFFVSFFSAYFQAYRNKKYYSLFSTLDVPFCRFFIFSFSSSNYSFTILVARPFTLIFRSRMIRRSLLDFFFDCTDLLLIGMDYYLKMMHWNSYDHYRDTDSCWLNDEQMHTMRINKLQLDDNRNFQIVLRFAFFRCLYLSQSRSLTHSINPYSDDDDTFDACFVVLRFDLLCRVRFFLFLIKNYCHSSGKSIEFTHSHKRASILFLPFRLPEKLVAEIEEQNMEKKRSRIFDCCFLSVLKTINYCVDEENGKLRIKSQHNNFL